MAVQYISAEGLEKVKQELQELKTTGRREAAAKIEVAKALGDLSENAEYHEAKEHLAFIEGRIAELDEIIKKAIIIEDTGSTETVSVGSTVDVMVQGKQKTFTIAGSNEAAPADGKISNESPIGSALLGAKVGQAVEVRSPAGTTTYVVEAIR